MKIIIDFDGTLTAEEEQVPLLSKLSLDTLTDEIIGASRDELEAIYLSTRKRLLLSPRDYWWEVNGLVASYCDEGAFILNTVTLQVMLRENPAYSSALTTYFPNAEYDPVVDCTNYLFHRHTAELEPVFRPSARGVLDTLLSHPNRDPIILTNSLKDKVKRHLDILALDQPVEILGDTRQYEMMPEWAHHFPHPELGDVQIWPVLPGYSVDLRRPDYYRALIRETADGAQLAVAADTFSLPGAIPLIMGIPFFLTRTPYTPDWCVKAVASHPLGTVLNDLDELPTALEDFSR